MFKHAGVGAKQIWCGFTYLSVVTTTGFHDSFCVLTHDFIITLLFLSSHISYQEMDRICVRFPVTAERIMIIEAMALSFPAEPVRTA